tara:strand:- start:323 stop:1159 length:837 start_codon:yes stop_codon:yes gene_type:complete
MIKKLFYSICWQLSKALNIKSINKNLAILNLENNYLKIRENNENNLILFGRKVFSQSDEDGIIDEIFKRISTKSKYFVEIGVQDGKECNTTNLLLQNWKGIWIEKDRKFAEAAKKNFEKFSESIKVINEGANIDNIDALITSNIGNDVKNTEVDLLSIDIGLNNFHVLKAITSIKPRVIVTEYNAKFGPIINWVAEYDDTKEWDNSDYFGASFNAYCKMLSDKDYHLVSCNITGVNCFFVRKDLLNDKFEKDHDLINLYQPARYNLIKAFEPDLKIRI